MSWLSRILRAPRTRGFGVQSPTDYHFIRHVVSQKMPYYAYGQLDGYTTHLSKREVEILHFYFRLANYVQDRSPIYILGKEVFGNITTELRQKFMSAGSRKSIVHQSSRLPASLTLDTQCVLIIENPQSAKAQISDSPYPKVIFDMQDIAVAFCNPKRYKIIYKINL